MSRRNTATDENSVNMALVDLMGIEQERLAVEEEALREKDRLEKERREAEAQEEREKAEAARKAAEAAKVAEEERLAKKKRDEARQARDQKVLIESRVEAESRMAEQQRLLDFQLEMKRISASGKRIGSWVWPFVAVLILAVIGISAMVITSISSGADSRVDFANEMLDKAKEDASVSIANVQTILRETQEKNDRLTRKIANMESEIEDMKTREPQAGNGRKKPGQRPRPGNRPPRNEDNTIENIGSATSSGAADDPSNGDIDWGPSKKKGKKR